MRWIRWETGTPDHPLVGELAAALRCKRAQALGHYNAVCCRMGDHQEDGHLAGVPDVTLEVWAAWEGKRGLFAQVFRDRCQDAHGDLKGWWRQAKLVERKEKDRNRKRTSAGIPPERDTNSGGKSVEPGVDSAGIPRSHAPSPSRGGEVEGEREGARGRETSWPPELEDALEPYLRVARFPFAVTSTVRLLLNPEHAPHFTAAELAAALRQMQGNNRDFSEGTLTTWCQRNQTRPPEPVPFPRRVPVATVEADQGNEFDRLTRELRAQEKK